MARPTHARIDLKALRHNYALARRLHGGRALAVLKANAYGHGATQCARALSGVTDGYAVAFLEEALTLREAGIRGPILLLEGVFQAEELELATIHSLWTVVHQESQLRMLEDGRRRNLNVWLKVDSGMGRAGFAPAEVAAAYARLRASGSVSEITLMTHFARADEPNHGATAHQIAVFDSATAGLSGDHSLCNSGGVLGWSDARRDWARPGIMLYGVEPMPHATNGLRPVMTLTSEIFAVRTLRPGDALGYGGDYVAQRQTRVGLVAIGYADGYPRSASTGTPVAIDGHPTRLVGRVSMDMLMVDITTLPAAGIGSSVELWGAQVDVNAVARAAGTIAYELLCNVKRVPFSYVECPMVANDRADGTQQEVARAPVRGDRTRQSARLSFSSTDGFGPVAPLLLEVAIPLDRSLLTRK
ncbi:alanine racemase [Caenimonas soli]|uniref:alanine racemase n=1 Tax=Caenimonas soli TaxID=2735555 RepID=UPI0015563A55|nr:alanine racemase [Caenimonas soli]NPC57806.1 alanine racemase [Caenimonas soli]